MRSSGESQSPQIKGTNPGQDPAKADQPGIEGQVRGFLRSDSNWIVMDRESSIDLPPSRDIGLAALRRGAVFASSPSLLPEGEEQLRPSDEATSLLTAPASPSSIPPKMFESTRRKQQQPMFPVTTSEPVKEEPSSLISTHDLEAQAAVQVQASSKRYVMGILAIGALAALALVGVKQMQQLKPQAAQSVAAVSLPPPAVDAPSVPAPEATPIEFEATPTMASPVVADAKPKGLGKLTIKGDAKTKNVWLDGKRMLGAGQRSFLVGCGMHTIAVADKADMKDIEIPCNGELTVSK